jgi:hypothetical protein
MAKKWTVEWAMRKYGVVKKDTHYYCGDRNIFVTSGAKDTYWLGEFNNTEILKEKAAVKWLVSGQPRIDKRKKKWVMVKEYDTENNVFITVTKPDIRFKLSAINGIPHMKVYKLSEANDGKAE